VRRGANLAVAPAQSPVERESALRVDRSTCTEHGEVKAHAAWIARTDRATDPSACMPQPRLTGRVLDLMQLAVALVVLVVSSEVAAGAPPSATSEIVRKTAASLPADPNANDVASLLIDSHWFQHNPKKATSTWATRFFVFLPDGIVSVQRDDGSMPVTLRWKVVRAGKRPVISVDGKRLSLATCSHGKSRTLCLFGS
jgi:hypothetical protein